MNSLKQLFFNFSNQQGQNLNIITSPHNEKVYNLLFKGDRQFISPFVLIVGQKYSGKTLLLNNFCNSTDSCKALSLQSLKGFATNYQYYTLDNLQNINQENEEDLFHFLNHVIANKKYVVIASDKHIDDINFKTKDVYSRIKSSLMFYIEKPKEEIMRQIFASMCYNLGFIIDSKTIDYIFKNINTDFKTLGDFAHKMYSSKMAMNRQVTLPFVKELLKAR